MIVGAILAQNEADRYLLATIRSMQPHCDSILVLDDGSTDDTVAVAQAEGCAVRTRVGEPMWGKESPARQELWSWGSEVAGQGWLLIGDADQELVAPPDVWRAMTTSWNATAWAFPLYDCWDSPQLHRSDGHWAAYAVSRPWLFRPSACPNPIWSERGIHCGHAPVNFNYVLGHAPTSVWWRHFGWMSRADREAKVERYLGAKDQLNQGEMAHLMSALDQ